MKPLGWVRLAGCALALTGCEDDNSVLRQVPGTLSGPLSVDFGDVPLGIEVTRQIELRNGGGSSVTLIGLEVDDNVIALDVPVPRADAEEIPPGGTLPLPVDLTALRVTQEPGEVILRIRARTLEESLTLEIPVRARGVDQLLVVRPSVSFGRTRIGTVASRTIEVINLLNESVDLRADRFDGNQVQFEGRSGLFRVVESVDPNRDGSLLPEGTRLAPGAATRLTIEYRPTAAAVGTMNRDEFKLRTCDQVQCEATVTVTGIAVRDGLTCVPEDGRLDFGAVRVGRTRTLFAKCTNASNVPLLIDGWSLEDADDAFSVDPLRPGPFRLEEGEVFEVAVRFDARLEDLGDDQFAALEILGRAEEDRNPIVLVELQALATAGGPQLEVSPARLDLGEVRVDRTGNGKLSLSSVGSADVTLSSVTLEGAGADAFSFEEPVSVLSRGLTRDVPVAFRPLTAGPFQATLVIDSDDPENPEIRVLLTGVGVDVGPCESTPLPSSIAFGAVSAGATSGQTLVIRNVGSQDCIFREFEVEGPDRAAFRLLDPPAPSVRVAPGESTLVRLRFSPFVEGEFTAFATYDASGARRVVNLGGTGELDDLLITPVTLDFGQVETGCTAPPAQVRLTNVGPLPIPISGLRIDTRQGDPNAVSIVDAPAGFPPSPGDMSQISPSQTVRLGVRYRALQSGAVVADLVVEQPNEEDRRVSIVGESVRGAVQVESFAQDEVAKLDVLFVVDNSFSMNRRLEYFRNQLNEIFGALVDTGVDYQVGVVSMDMRGEQANITVAPCGFPAAQPPDPWLRGSCGFLTDGTDDSNRPEWAIIDPTDTPAPVDAFRQAMRLPERGPPVETGLLAMRAALTPPQTEGWNAGFIRPDADLAVIILSDETDSSPGPVESYVQILKSLKDGGDQRASINAVVPSDLFGTHPAAPEVGFSVLNRYRQAAVATDGVVLNSDLPPDASDEVQARAYAERIILVLDRTLSPRSAFRLEGIPAPGTVQIAVDGAPLPGTSPSGELNWEFDAADNRIIFTERGQPRPGQSFEVRYRNICF